MKKTKSRNLAVPRSSRVSASKSSRPKKSTKKANRALHVKISLHPISLMIVLCAGVLLLCTSFNAFGDVVNVNIQAPPPQVAADITSIADGSTTDQVVANVSGTCPDGSYIDIYDNNSITATSYCNGGTFSATLLLTVGSNVLLAEDYNFGSASGPVLAPITVNYEPHVAPKPVVVPPVALTVSQVDSSVSYSPDSIQQTDAFPTFSGVTEPYSTVTIMVHSKPVYCTTTANSYGYWQCTLTAPLPEGQHSVYISATTKDGQKLVFPVFKIKAIPAKTRQARSTSELLKLSSSYHYQMYKINQTIPVELKISGGSAPYTLSIDWGDGQVQTFQTDSLDYLCKHVYQAIKNDVAAYPIKFQVVDALGNTSASESFAVIKNSVPIANTIGGHNGLPGTLVSDIHSWLWLLWPGYTIVLLMVLSFWLGEREELHVLLRRRKHTSRARATR